MKGAPLLLSQRDVDYASARTGFEALAQTQPGCRPNWDGTRGGDARCLKLLLDTHSRRAHG